MADRPLKPRLQEVQLSNARQMRRQPTDAERRLWFMLRDRRLDGFKFRRQTSIGPYVLDYYCHECQLGVEADGGQHTRPADLAKDQTRTAYLASHGIEVVRYSNVDVLKNSDGVRADLQQRLRGRREQVDVRPHPGPLPEGEGGSAFSHRGPSSTGEDGPAC